MGVQAVIILVQAAIILVLLVVAVWGCRRLVVLQFNARVDEAKYSILEESLKTIRADWESAKSAAFERGRASASTNPLPQKPKQAQDSVIRAKSPAHVRQLTEQHFGTKPGDEEHVN